MLTAASPELKHLFGGGWEHSHMHGWTGVGLLDALALDSLLPKQQPGPINNPSAGKQIVGPVKRAGLASDRED